MPVGEVLVIVMFVTTFACLLAGFPVAFTLSGVALLFGSSRTTSASSTSAFWRAHAGESHLRHAMERPVLIAVPAFISWGAWLERSKWERAARSHWGASSADLRGGIGSR